MIVVEKIKIKEKEYIKTYSDSGYMIERDGIQYDEAIDPIKYKEERIYTETDIFIET